MSFTNLVTTAIDSVVDEILSQPNPSVCDLGNQRLKNESARTALFRRKNINKTCTTTKQFYLALGFERYLAIDVNTEKDAVAMDLNMDIVSHYNFEEKFNLVTNNGTGEHIFNQLAVFRNTHNITKVGGFMIHVLPFYRWVDHGFYNFHPNLFFCLANQNNYKMHGVWIGTSNASQLVKLEHKLSRDKGYRGRYNLDSWQRDPMVAAIMQKVDDKEFEMPQQHVYAGDNITSNEISERYK